MNLEEIKSIVNQFEPIDLSAMDGVSLMRRVDQKFTLTKKQLKSLLQKMSNDYSCLTIDDCRVFSYENQYFDTKDKKMFLFHHNGKRNRYKIRIRDYVESKLSFLEIKFKNNKSETIKSRINLNFKERKISNKGSDFISEKSIFNLKEIESKLLNSFKRITLVSLENKERVTIDIELNFESASKEISLPNLVIVEVKREKTSKKSALLSLLKENKIRASNFSKYAIGSVLTNPELRYNKFKNKLLYLNKIHPDGNIWNTTF